MGEKKADNLEIGALLGHYRVISKIGAGGMGEVYLANDSRLNRKVAVKVLSGNFDEDRLHRFKQEAVSASALNHPNILTIYEIGEFEKTQYISAEYVEGETLHDLLKRTPMNLETVMNIILQVVSALDVAHRADIVHRDIKPDNVMIRPDGLVKLLDFGVAKLAAENSFIEDDGANATTIKINTSPGMIIGTANYMSPEQARGKVVDARTDIFSFGVMLYEMLAGQKTFPG